MAPRTPDGTERAQIGRGRCAFLGSVSALFVFDMDGTLLPGTTASLALAATLGAVDDLHALEARFAAGELDTRGFAGAVHELFAALTPEQVASTFTAARLLDRVADVFADIRARGERSLVITMSPDFFAHQLLAVGADAVHGSRFPTPPYPGVEFDPSGILTPDDKPRLVAEALAAAAIPPERCVAFGDSMSDAPLFRALRHTVAVNADDHLLDLAAATYAGDDLWAAYDLGRSLLDRVSPRSGSG
jgi:phosphoserine phosphatase